MATERNITTKPSMMHAISVMLLAGVALCGSLGAARTQQSQAVAISVKAHHFQPAEVHAAANRPLELSVKNLDPAPMEFESVSLRVEKVIPGGSAGAVHVRALAPGRYEFFDDFHQETRGTLVVE